MARLFYMSLPGVGAWNKTCAQVGAQLRPYFDYLETAKRAAKRRQLVLGWRLAQEAEAQELQRRLKERWNADASRARQARRRRDRHTSSIPRGTWIVLEAPPWQPEEPDKTFDAFFEARSVYEHPACRRGNEIQRLDHDREGLALLLDRVPERFGPDEGEDDPPATAAKQHGPLLWLRTDTSTLDRQLDALRELENTPPPRLAPIIRLASTRARWPDVVRVELDEDEWTFLRRDPEDGSLRDGTDQQREFVCIALGTPDFAILEGPPGSGKTTAICELVVQLLRQGKRVLLVASTHVAVDNVLERLIAWQDRPDTREKIIVPVRIGDEDRITSDALTPFTLRRIEQTWRDELSDFLDDPGDVRAEGTAARQILKQAMTHNGRGAESPLLRLILDASNLVCGTTMGIRKHPAIEAAKRGGPRFEPFDLMVLDEASKTTFAEFLVPALHARRWVVVGDIKQLSPYIEEVNLAENVRGLVPEHQARASAHAFLAGLRGGARVRSLVATSDADRDIVRQEVEARGVHFVDLDDVEPMPWNGVPDCVPALLYADLVFGSKEALERHEHRLPVDLVGMSGPLPALPDWHAARRALVRKERSRQRHIELSEVVDWASEVSWRLVRSYELRQDAGERDRYLDEIKGLIPATLADDWFQWRKTRPRRQPDGDGQEDAAQALDRELQTIRRVAMPSILELLQTGFERLPGWDQDVALTDGLPRRVLGQRLVSLGFQHRMHPHISAFPREQFYTPEPETSGTLHPAREPGRPDLLLDASTIAAERAWELNRYARRALWIDVAPGGRGRGKKNTNLAEADKVMEELDAFVAWASRAPRRAEHGRHRPYEVAVLTFYRGQEAELRKRLQRKTGQHGNTRNFRFPRGAAQPAVHVTLCTVDRFQGHEADIVFLSFVKSNSVGFLNSPNRLNVALTRARYQIVLIGHRSYFGSDGCPSERLKALADSPHYDGDIGWEVRS